MLYRKHEPVLLQDVVNGLAITRDGIYIDATFGRGGHSQAILKHLGSNGRLIALDQDPEAVEAASQIGIFCQDLRFHIKQAAFSNLKHIIQNLGWIGKVNGILIDLGVSSPQLDDAKRGFSFNQNGPLDMRMNPNIGIDAKTWINRASLSEIIRILRQYGEERFAKRIAKAIHSARHISEIATTAQLSHIITEAVPRTRQERYKHPATRTFQAIRIFMNQELDELRHVLAQSLNVLNVGGRLCVISFHSLEDRIVKHFIQRHSTGRDDYLSDLPVKDVTLRRRFKKIGKLIRASACEIKNNPRARSARLRIAEKLD